MRTDYVDALRYDVQRLQRTSTPLAPLMDALYTFRDQLVNDAFFDHRPTANLPMLSVEMDPHNWRGKYSSVGAFGFTEVIVLNAHRLNDGAEAARTLAHELGHWFVQEPQGHSEQWRDTMFERCGLVYNEHGQWLRDVGLWWELTSTETGVWLADFALS